VARQTRQQRRARREKKAQSSGSSGVVGRARSRQQQVRPASQPAKGQGGQRRQEGRRRFVVESWGELKKVDWPSQAQVIQGTIVVLIACAIVGAYLFAADQVFKRLVQNLLLGQ
jgi:preprotein translocase SecE subunit